MSDWHNVDENLSPFWSFLSNFPSFRSFKCFLEEIVSSTHLSI